MPGASDRLFVQAEGYLELGLPDEAIKTLDAVGASDRNSYPWNRLRGEILRDEGKHTEAIEYLDAARRINPDALDVYIALGWCYKRSEQLARAIESLLEAKARASQSKEKGFAALVDYNLSCYYSLARRKEEMLRLLNSALERSPDYLEMIPAETDFDPFRDDDDFRTLVAFHEKKSRTA